MLQLGTYLAYLITPVKLPGSMKENGMKILLAENDKNFGIVLKTELEQENYEVDLVTNGTEAIFNFMERSYSLVILDMNIPRLSGIETLRIIKKLNPQIPVVAFSAHAYSKEISESIQHGATKCLAKPFPLAQLTNDIRTFLSAQNTADAGCQMTEKRWTRDEGR